MAEGLEDMGPGVIVAALQVLVTPSDRTAKPQDARPGECGHLQRVLQASLEELHQRLSAERKFCQLQGYLSSINCCTCPADPQWSFVLHCLHLLSLLRKSLTSAMEQFSREEAEKGASRARKPNQAPPLPPDTLSLQQQGVVSRVLQFLVCLGVVPSLHPGVGLPLAARSEFASKLVDTGNLSSEVQVSRLLVCSHVLVDCLDVGSLSSLLLSRHLSDLLALLLQLCHGTKWETVTVLESSGLYPPRGNAHGFSEGTKSTEGQLASEKKSETHDPSSDDANDLDTKVQVQTTERDVIPNSTSENGSESLTSQHKETTPALDINATHNSADCSSSVPTEHISSTQTSSQSSLHHRELCSRWLQKVLKKVPPHLLVRELLVLQGRPQKGAPPKGRAEPLGGVQGAPSWLRRVCGRLLCGILTDKKGVLHVLAGMMQGPEGGFTSDWRSCDAVAKVMVMGAKTVADKESYFSRVCPQVLSLLRQPGRAGERHLARVVSASLRELLALDGDLAQRHLVQPLLAPLLRCCHGNGTEYRPGEVLVPEDELTICMEDLHKVLVLAAEPDSSSLLCLHPALPALFQVYCTARSGVSHLRSPSRELLTAYLRKEETTLALASLQFLLLGLDPEKRFQPVPDCLQLQPGPQGGVVVTVRPEEGADTEDVPCFLTEEDCQGAVELLSALQTCGLAGEFLIFLMKELTKIIRAETGSDAGEDVQAALDRAQDTERHEKTLLEMERRQQAALMSFQRRLSMLSLLAAMCEALGPDCLKSTLHILEFVQATLQRGVEVCQNAEEELTGLFESETLSMAMGLLTAVMAEGKKLGEAERQKMDELLPLLELILTNHSDPTVQEMAADLRIAIATRGVVWSSLMKDKVATAEAAQKERAQKSETEPTITPTQKKSSRPLIEVLSETVTEEPSADSSPKKSPEDVPSHNTPPAAESKPGLQNVASGKPPSIKPPTSGLGDLVIPVSCKGGERSALKQAYEELCDPLIPVRGHALLTLTYLLEEGNAEALADMDTLLQVFMENVAHGDSYLYLASVGGLAALAGRCHQTVMPRLAAEFADWHSPDKTPKSAELRAKLGEVLVKATRNLGDLAPRYRDVLLRSLLCGTRDTDAMVRASSLSSLAELCCLLRYALGPVLHEVLECCSSLLKTDVEVEVRKAAALMLTQLLSGLGKDVFKVLEAVLRDLYRLLKLRVAVEREEGVRLHLALALQQLDDVMRESLFAKPVLEKKIRVRSAE